MKKLILLLFSICLLTVPAFAVELSDFETINPDGSTTIDYQAYNAAVAAEKVAAAGLDLDVNAYWVTNWLDVTYFDTDAFEADYAAALAAKQAQEEVTQDPLLEDPIESPSASTEQEVIPDDTPNSDEPVDTGDTGYPIGSFIDEEGNVYSPEGELLSSGSETSAPVGIDDPTSTGLLDGEGTNAGDGNAATPTVYTVSDLRSGGDTSGSLVSGLKALIVSIFGEYEPVLTTAAITETVDNVTTTTLIDVVADAFEIVTCTFSECGRYAECNDHAGNSGMNSGIQHEIPENQTYYHIKFPGTALQNVSCNHDCHTSSAQQQEHHIYV